MTALTRRAAIAGGLCTLTLAAARANPDWPDRPITMVHGFPAGGPTDLVARIVADGLTRRLGQRVLVEGKPGASGTTAAAQIARTAPDGYTLFAIPSGHTFAAATFKTLPYRTIDDFSMISMFTEYPYLMVTHADHAIRTVADLINLARSAVDAAALRHPRQRLGPAPGGRAARQRGQDQAPARALSRQRTGGDRPDRQAPRLHDGSAGGAARIRARRQAARVAVTGDRRFFAVPDTPTVAESGVPGYLVSAWQGLVAPAGLPPAIVNRLNAEVTGVLREPTVVERLRALGNEPRPTTPDEFKARMAADIAKWTAVVDGGSFERI